MLAELKETQGVQSLGLGLASFPRGARREVFGYNWRPTIEAADLPHSGVKGFPCPAPLFVSYC
jgi:hypothetical protein